MAVAQRIDAAAYERLALEEAGRFVELRDSMLVEKPAVSFGHARTIERFSRQLRPQLDPDDHLIFVESARLRGGESYLIPDLVVIPAEVERAAFDRDPHRLAVYDDPVPLVVEVWSPSTGAYDTRTKLPLYLARGDREIWFVDPFERTLSASVRRADGTYEETIHTAGIVECASLPGVRVDLGALFG
ncbi:MAG: Uma2 family endonuclease [Chloroflexia bacterium]|nr:Uma2 family endonuclease [Chloroflexia bacterium]